MKFYENKKTWKKIVIMFLIVLFFQIGFAMPVRAADDGDDNEPGGILLGPIMSLIIGLGDRSSKHTSSVYIRTDRNRN